jgi:hypothetical protein
MPTMRGHFAVFNSGRRSAAASRVTSSSGRRGAFAKTFARTATGSGALPARQRPVRRRQAARADQALEEHDEGAYYEVPLLDTAYNREILPGSRRASTARRSGSP